MLYAVTTATSTIYSYSFLLLGHLPVNSPWPPWPVIFPILFLWCYNHNQPGITVPTSGGVTSYLYYLIFPTYIVDGYKSPDSAVSSTFNIYHKWSSWMQWFSHQFHRHCCLTSWLLYGPTDRVTALFFKCGLLDDPCQNFLFPYSPLPHLHLPYLVIHLVYIHRT